MDTLLDVIDSHYGHPRPNYRGDRVVLCPFHPDRHVGSFSYSERGFVCFSCGEKGGLHRLADQLGIRDNRPAPIIALPKARPRPVRVHDWQRDPDYWRRYLDLPGEARAYYHRRGFSDETIQARGLGYGVLPASRCGLPRLILPVFADGRLVALRGRAFLPADLDDKWLCAGGSQTVLYGAESLGCGRVVVITEAPYSAILAHQSRPDVAAVAGTAGASCWRDEWTHRIAESLPAWCLVVYDNDEAGAINGPKVARALERVGVRARVYQWPRGTVEHRDLADELVAGKEMPISVIRPTPRALVGVDRGLW